MLTAACICSVVHSLKPAPYGAVAAIRTVFLGAAWQECRLHFIRGVFSMMEKVPRKWSRRSPHHLRAGHRRGHPYSAGRGG
nr:transposase [Streptomyces actinomycinicus]